MQATSLAILFVDCSLLSPLANVKIVSSTLHLFRCMGHQSGDPPFSSYRTQFDEDATI